MNCPANALPEVEASFSMERILDGKKDRAKSADYAMPTDFCQVFDEHLDHLYTLALLLTADHHQGDQCVVSGLEDCLQGNPVFREWAQSWARRAVIKNAIRMISPSRNGTKTTGTHEPSETLAEAHTAAAAITRLHPFERFVYVLSVLEKYSDRECSIMLDCALGEVVDARTRALRRLVSVVGGNSPAETASLATGAA
jgi:DNA-directed RNA polymerase specialized sigma24 family protein